MGSVKGKKGPVLLFKCKNHQAQIKLIVVNVEFPYWPWYVYHIFKSLMACGRSGSLISWEKISLSNDKFLNDLLSFSSLQRKCLDEWKGAGNKLIKN